LTQKTIILITFILLKFGLQSILISPEYELQRDEYLHLDQANHLAWGYLSVPPVTSWISWLIKLLGNSVFWIKFFPACFGALTMLMVWKTIETLKGNLFALILGGTCILFSVLLRLNTLYQPNSLDVLCWTTMYFVCIKYFQTTKPKWLYLGALVFAIGFLNKYNIVFLLIGLLPALLITKQRNIFSNPKLYLAILLGLLFISPNLIWQYQNHFPVIHHMSELAEKHLVHVDRKAFFISQVMFYIGSLVVILCGFFALAVYPAFKSYRFLFWSFLFTLCTFTFFKAKDYYAIGLYPIYISFGAVYVDHILKNTTRRVLQPLLLCMPLLFFVPMYDRFFPNKSPQYIVANEAKYKPYGLLRWEDGENHALPQDFADMLGWKELAEKIDQIYDQIPERHKTIIICDNYGQAGAINYYTKKGLRAVSFNADYVNWFQMDTVYTNLIRVKNKSEQSTEFDETSPYFNHSSISDSITNPYARESGATIFTFVGAKIDINKQIQKEIDESRVYLHR
jgi:hypothetical protein